MPSLIDIRRRIRSVKNTQQITKAMKMVSAAKLRRAQEQVINSRPFARMLNDMLRNVAAAVDAANDSGESHPLMTRREENRIQLVVVTSDRGLAGAFNSSLIKAAQQFVVDRPGKQIEFELYGRKARDFFVRRGVKVSGEMTGISLTPTVDHARALAEKLSKRFIEDEIDAVYFIYNEFKSVLSQKVVIRKVLPIEVSTEAPARDYIFEQPPVEFLAHLLPHTIFTQVLEVFLETAASELAARMTAMDAATNNATDVISKLTLYMNKVRQASITREIIEVVSGAASALE